MTLAFQIQPGHSPDGDRSIHPTVEALSGKEILTAAIARMNDAKEMQRAGFDPDAVERAKGAASILLDTINDGKTLSLTQAARLEEYVKPVSPNNSNVYIMSSWVNSCRAPEPGPRAIGEGIRAKDVLQASIERLTDPAITKEAGFDPDAAQRAEGVARILLDTVNETATLTPSQAERVEEYVRPVSRNNANVYAMAGWINSCRG